MMKINLKNLFALATAISSMPVLAESTLLEKTLAVCESLGYAEALCGIPAPEDIEVLPDGKHLLLSSFGGYRMGAHPFPQYLLNIVTLKATPVVAHYEDNPVVRWDEGFCPKPPVQIFPAHGIHVSKRDGGAWQLLAVNHERESVEMFEIDIRNHVPALIWRGCIVMPGNSLLNDVVALRGGGFLVSNMMALGENPLGDKPSQTIVRLNEEQGPTGFVLRWRPGFGTDKLPGSDGDLVNGVAISADGNSVFFSESGKHRVMRISYHSGKRQGHVEAAADNLSWAKDGRLVVTGLTDLPENCLKMDGICRASFEVRAIDTDTLETELLYSSDGIPMGGGTVAVFQKEYMYVGSFMGNRLLRVRMESDEGKKQ